MTEEEMAEAQIKEWDSLLCPQMYPVALVKDFIRKAYLAGLKAGRPKFHKVADGDYPSCDELVLFRTDVGYYLGKIDRSKKLWWTGFCLDDSVSNAFVIAWCEIPKYKKE